MITSMLMFLMVALSASIQAEQAGTPEQVGETGCVFDGKLKKVSGGFEFTEGPAPDGRGRIWFTDIARSQILRCDEDGSIHTVMERTDGCNGLQFDKDGRLVACQGQKGRVVRIDPATKKITPLVTMYEDSPFITTNDLALDQHGGVYFTDPAYWRNPDSTLDEAVYYSDSGGKVTRILDGFRRPNGILLSPDMKTLYVLPAGQPELMAYSITSPGVLGKGGRLAKLEGGGDGLTCDTLGTLYITQPRSRKILVIDPDGSIIESVDVPEGPSNCTIGGTEFDTLYITARTGLYSIKLNRTGIRTAHGQESKDGSAGDDASD